MSTHLPNSPVKTVKSCRKCGRVSVTFWNSNYDCAYTKDEWEIIMTEGKQNLDRLLQNVRENPAFFLS